jgi:hypothetical protein
MYAYIAGISPGLPCGASRRRIQYNVGEAERREGRARFVTRVHGFDFQPGRAGPMRRPFAGGSPSACGCARLGAGWPS